METKVIMSAVAAAGMVFCGGHVAAQSVEPQQFPGYMDFQGSYLAVLSDVDMVASAYNGPPIGPRTEAMVDTLTLFPLNGGMPSAPLTVPVGNAVTAWPSLLGFTPDGRTAYVAETELPATPDARSRADLEPSGMLRVIAIGEDLQGEIVQEIDTQSRAIAVSVRPQGDVLAVATTRPGRLATGATDGESPQLGFFEIGADGRLGEMQSIPLEDAEGDPPHIEWSPDGSLLAITIAGSDRVRFYSWDGEILSLHGNAVGTGKLPAPGHWSPDGRHFFVTNLYWGGDVRGIYYGAEMSTLAAIRVAPAAADEPRHLLVSAAATGPAAEEFAISPDGNTLVTLNMERSYTMPDAADLTYYSSLTLLSWDDETERLTPRGTYAFEGILPEGITFDNSGRFLAVANFAHFNPNRPVEETTVDIWRLIESPTPMLVQTDVKLPVMRGAHVAKTVNLTR